MLLFILLLKQAQAQKSMYEIEKYVGTNIGGTALLLDILTNTKHHVKRVLVAESRAIYAEQIPLSKIGDVYPMDRSDEDMARGRF